VRIPPLLTLVSVIDGLSRAGIKPLSIYGLVHFCRRERGTLITHVPSVSPEEQMRIVALLREHLLDVDDGLDQWNARDSSLDPPTSSNGSVTLHPATQDTDHLIERRAEMYQVA
jgi:hypothetical protein